MKGKQKSSSGNTRCKYLRLSFWLQPENQFWNSESYSQASRDYYEKLLNEQAKKEKYLPNLSNELK